MGVEGWGAAGAAPAARVPHARAAFSTGARGAPCPRECVAPVRQREGSALASGGDYRTCSVFSFVLVQTKGGLAYPVHQMALQTTFRNQGSELSSDPMIPQMTVVADLTRSERMS